jgi:hypothetical protein
MMTTPKFTLGSLVATSAALEALERAGQSPAEFLTCHAGGDRGEVDATDRKLNDAAIKNGERILSAYKTRDGVKLWVKAAQSRRTGHRWTREEAVAAGRKGGLASQSGGSRFDSESGAKAARKRRRR